MDTVLFFVDILEHLHEVLAVQRVCLVRIELAGIELAKAVACIEFNELRFVLTLNVGEFAAYLVLNPTDLLAGNVKEFIAGYELVAAIGIIFSLTGQLEGLKVCILSYRRCRWRTLQSCA